MKSRIFLPTPAPSRSLHLPACATPRRRRTAPPFVSAMARIRFAQFGTSAKIAAAAGVARRCGGPRQADTVCDRMFQAPSRAVRRGGYARASHSRLRIPRCGGGAAAAGGPQRRPRLRWPECTEPAPCAKSRAARTNGFDGWAFMCAVNEEVTIQRFADKGISNTPSCSLLSATEH